MKIRTLITNFKNKGIFYILLFLKSNLPSPIRINSYALFTMSWFILLSSSLSNLELEKLIKCIMFPDTVSEMALFGVLKKRTHKWLQS